MGFDGISSVRSNPAHSSPPKTINILNHMRSEQREQDKQKNVSKTAEAQGNSTNMQQQVNEEDLIKAIEKANESFKGKNARFEYSIHEETKKIMVKIVNPTNDEVIKEIPSEKILDMVAKIWEMSGLLVDEKR
ncbi:flagellar protein FlaG [Desulfuribacillus stibiiarsenatis]|nr:flagellar protein FlaG [Desulfuribacillus stibiiarsenatis]